MFKDTNPFSDADLNELTIYLIFRKFLFDEMR